MWGRRNVGERWFEAELTERYPFGRRLERQRSFLMGKKVTSQRRACSSSTIMLRCALREGGRKARASEEARRRNEPAESPPEVKTASFRGTLSRLAGAKSSDAGTGIVDRFGVCLFGWWVGWKGGSQRQRRMVLEEETKVQLLLGFRWKRQLANKK